MGILIAVFLLLTIRAIGRSRGNRLRTWETFRKELDRHKIDEDNTDIFIIAAHFNGEKRILVRSKDSWGYMLPYARNIDPRSPEELEERLKKEFPGAAFRLVTVREELSDQLKLHPSGVPKLFSYRFHLAKTIISQAAFDRLLKDALHAGDYRWMTLESLGSHSLTLQNNFDVISFLSRNKIVEMCEDSFSHCATDSASSAMRDIKVIWNITTYCQHDCKFCATNATQAGNGDLGFEQRLDIASRLHQIPGLRLDFAGGDPMDDVPTVKAMQYIREFIVREDVTVTTTGGVR